MTDRDAIPTPEDLPQLHRWISVAKISFDLDDLKRLANTTRRDLIVEADSLGLAIYDAERAPVLWVDSITPQGDTREDFEEEMAEFRARVEGRSPAAITRVLDRAQTIIALSPFRRAAPEAAEALAEAVGAQVRAQGETILHIVGKGFFDASGALILAEAD